ncbi:Post-transcriptional regulator [Bhargavaea ginsengi]|uniref:Post-transcriptional regulator n=1 Tax=Bhargavaea ginsengi TaxID=426757 RepID=A0A1H6X3Z9_9BACL|nr:post-transcriptional regulator [Bhargavaea ginsengi]SEJ23903.1 Post-transcriptional regulator [Bhargavaea ginsengi]
MAEEGFPDLFEQVRPALSNKTDEFVFYGYGSVTEEDLWSYCLGKLWRKKDLHELPVHEAVGDILSISPTRYMSHTQVEGFKKAAGNSSFGGLDEEEFRELLAPKGQKREGHTAQRLN